MYPLSDENQIKVFLRAVLVIESDERECGDLGRDMIDVFMTVILMASGVYLYIIIYQFLCYGGFICCMSNISMYIPLKRNETISSPNLKGHNSSFPNNQNGNNLNVHPLKSVSNVHRKFSQSLKEVKYWYML